MERRLTTILVADVVGWSRMAAADEDRVIARLHDAMDEVINPAVGAGGGRIVKTMGDGFLAEFPSAVAAVEMAIAFQDTMAARERDVADAERLAFRVGVTVGDVVIDGDDILGNGVNVAARLEAIGRPGGIAASRTLVDALPSRLKAAFRCEGQKTLKNIPDPVEVWRWGSGATAVSDQAETASEPPSIAVLPFTSSGGDGEQRHLAEGLAEDIGSGLARMRRMPVVSPESSQIVAREDATTQEIAAALRARYLVRGTVRRAGDRVRITVQLLDGPTGRQVWSERYDGTLDDVFALQDEITLNVVTALEPEVVDIEIGRLRQKRPEQLGAWEHFLKGMGLIRGHGAADLAGARSEFEQALAIDPGYGEAWAGLAWTHLKDFGARHGDDPRANLDAGFEAAKKAVALDDRSPLTHYVMSTAYVWRDEPALSLAELDRALELNPFYVRAALARGNRLDLSTDRTDEALAEMQRALDLSPHDADRFWYFAAVSRIHLVRGQPGAALNWIERAISIRPEIAHLVFRRALCQAHLDDIDAARRDLETAEAMQPGIVAARRSWRPYTDDARNAEFFAGFIRHKLAGW